MVTYVDADACPMKSILVEEAEVHQVPCIFVCSLANHFSLQGSWVETIIVDSVYQAADMYIANHVKKGDIVITDDYGLACLVLAKGCLTISSRGKEYTNENIELLLMSRHQAAKERMSGKKTKGPKPITEQEEVQFRKLLKKCFVNGKDIVEF
jgi:uncharacterized protein YaiI (UPF0178 family)